MGATAVIGLTALGTGLSVSKQRKAQRAQEKATDISGAQASLENQRNIRRTVLQGRIAAAQTQAAGQAAAGGFGQSNVQGAIGSAQAQTAANVGFARQVNSANQAINARTQEANRALGQSALFGAVAQLPTQFGFSPQSVVQRRVDQNNAQPTG